MTRKTVEECWATQTGVHRWISVVTSENTSNSTVNYCAQFSKQYFYSFSKFLDSLIVNFFLGI